jgi:hypothetical protein
VGYPKTRSQLAIAESERAHLVASFDRFLEQLESRGAGAADLEALLGLDLNQGNLRKAIDRFPWYLAEWRRTGRGVRVVLSELGKELVEGIVCGETTVLVRDFYRMERPAEPFRSSKELGSLVGADCGG